MTITCRYCFALVELHFADEHLGWHRAQGHETQCSSLFERSGYLGQCVERHGHDGSHHDRLVRRSIGDGEVHWFHGRLSPAAELIAATPDPSTLAQALAEGRPA